MEDLKHFYFSRKVNRFRTFIIISLLTFDLMGVVDNLLIPEHQLVFSIIRYAIVTPLGLLVLWFTYSEYYRPFEKRYEAVLWTMIALLGLVLVWIHAEAALKGVFFYKHNILLHIIFIYFLSSIRFPYVSLLGWSTVVFYNIFVLAYDNINGLEFIEGNIVLIIANILGTVVSYLKESQQQQDKSLLESWITQEKEKEPDPPQDPITKLYLRSYFNKRAEELFVEENLPISIVVGDVNGLRKLNDSLGYSAGDELLQCLARTMKQFSRPHDLIARMGGDEFAIFLPRTDDHEAEIIMNEIKLEAERRKMQTFGVTITFGRETVGDLELKFCEVYRNAENKMYRSKLFESPSVRAKTIQAILYTLHEKNKREERHSQRVSKLCESIGKQLKLSETEVKELKSAGLLHDIGKVAIEEDILNKPGRLTSEERIVVERHSAIGYRILDSVSDMADIANYVLFHHERWDGNGYPLGLIGEEIPLQSRIIAIADTFDAMTSDRSYRKGLSQQVALEEIRRNAGTQFDPRLVEVFVNMLSDSEELANPLIS